MVPCEHTTKHATFLKSQDAAKALTGIQLSTERKNIHRTLSLTHADSLIHAAGTGVLDQLPCNTRRSKHHLAAEKSLSVITHLGGRTVLQAQPSTREHARHTINYGVRRADWMEVIWQPMFSSLLVTNTRVSQRSNTASWILNWNSINKQKEQ